MMPIVPPLIVGLVQASAYALYPLMGLYLLFPVFAVLGGWSRKSDRRQIRRWWLLVLPTAALLVLWFSGRLVWVIVWWLMLGDDAAYDLFANLSSGTVAMIVSATIFIRLATGRLDRRYLQINSLAVGLCAVLYGTVMFMEFASHIDGWTARGAAENKFAFMAEGTKWYPAHLPRRIVDETTPLLAERHGKAFALYVGDARVAEVHVMPRYRWWWSVSYFRNFPFGEGVSVEEQLKKFNEALKKRRPAEG